MIKKVVYWLPGTQTMEVTLAHAGTGIPVGNLMICYMKGYPNKMAPCESFAYPIGVSKTRNGEMAKWRNDIKGSNQSDQGNYRYTKICIFRLTLFTTVYNNVIRANKWIFRNEKNMYILYIYIYLKNTHTF